MGEFLFLLVILAIAILFTIAAFTIVDIVGKILSGIIAFLFWVISVWLISMALGD